MERIKCPLCKETCLVVEDNDHFGILSPVMMWHTPPEHTGLDQVRHIDSVTCLGTGLTEEFAGAVARYRREGAHLAGHP
jgi:hypothetical protein